MAATARLAFILYLVLSKFTTVTLLFGAIIGTLLVIIHMASFTSRMMAVKKTSLDNLSAIFG